MHDPFLASCADCGKFVRCYPPESPLGDWGYCRDEVAENPPSPEELKALEEEALRGRFLSLLNSRLRLFPETDDGCPRFVHRGGHRNL
jgi:hypothetical protein